MSAPREFRIIGLALLLAVSAAAHAGASLPAPAPLLAQQTSTSTDQAQPQIPALTQSELQQFLRIRQAERSALGNSFSSLQTIFEHIRNGQAPSFLQVSAALRDVGGSVGDARSAQQAALEREQLTQERFNAIRNQINRALGLPSIEFGSIFSDLKSGKLPSFDEAVKTGTDPQTKALIEPHRSELIATAPLGLLGL